jgi:hypothetical protein
MRFPRHVKIKANGTFWSARWLAFPDHWLTQLSAAVSLPIVVDLASISVL